MPIILHTLLALKIDEATCELLDAVEEADARWVGVVGKVGVQSDGFSRVRDVIRVRPDPDGPVRPGEGEGISPISY